MLHKCAETALTEEASLSKQLLQSAIVKVSLISNLQICTAIKGVFCIPFLLWRYVNQSSIRTKFSQTHVWGESEHL